MHLSTAGRAAMGTSVVSIDGATPAALVGQVAGGNFGPSWLSTTKILYQSGGTGTGPWILQSYDTGTLATATVNASGENEMAAGANVWAAWLAGSGVRTSVGGLGPFANAGLGDVSTDFGEIVTVTSRATGTGLTVYSSAGATLLSLPAVTLNVPLIRLRGHLLVYSETTGWKMQNVIGGAFGFAPRINETINWVTPVIAGTTQLVMERSERLTLRYAAKPDGWEVVAPGGLAFNPDVVALSANVVRLAWSTNQGETPAALQMTDLTLSTGATLNWVVSGGVLVSSAGPTLTRQQFEVGPLQGSAGGGSLYPPRQHPVTSQTTQNRVTDSWGKFFDQLNTGVTGNSAAIAAIPAPVAPPASFGLITAGGIPVAASMADDTLALTSTDGSVGLRANPLTKTVDLSVTTAVGRAVPSLVGLENDDLLALTIPGPPGTDGAVGPQGASGAGVPGPPGYDGEDFDPIVIPGPMGLPGSTGPQGASGAGVPGPPGYDGEDWDGTIMPGPTGGGTVAGGGGADFTGSGNPQGVQTGTGGQTYRDTTNGVLYQKLSTASSNTGWYRILPTVGPAMSALTFTPFFTAWVPGTGNWGFGGNGQTGASAQSFSESIVSGSRVDEADGFYRQGSTTSSANNAGWFANDFGGAFATWDMDFDVVFHIKTDPSSIATIRYFLALSDGNPTGDDPGVKFIGFRYATAASDGGWVGVTRSASASVTATVATIATDTVYTLRMRKISGTVYFSVNDGTEQSTSTEVPSGTTKPFFILYLQAVAGTKILKVQSMAGIRGLISS